MIESAQRWVRSALELDRRHTALRWAFLYFFFLLTGYYVLRPVRDAMGAVADVEAVFSPATIAWFAARGIAIGDFTLQALFTGTFIGMLVLQPVYGWLVSRFPRRVFLPVVYLAFIACPYVRDTVSVPCWLTEYEGETIIRVEREYAVLSVV